LCSETTYKISLAGFIDVKRLLVKIHRYGSLCFAIFWILQILSGILLVFSREFDDAIVLGASSQLVSPEAMEQARENISREGGSAGEYFISGGVAGQVDILGQDKSGKLRVWRVEGVDGRIERISAWSDPWWDLSIARGVLLFHKSLLAGATGRIIVIASGVLLLVNMLVGLRLVWPQKGRWRAILFPKRAASPIASFYTWHRFLGVWILPFGVITTLTGLGLLFLPSLQRATGSPAALPEQCEAIHADVQQHSSARAVERAKQVFPNAETVVVTLPSRSNICYTVQMRQPREWRRAFGTTRVYVDSRTYRVVSAWDAVEAPASVKAVTALYTVHSGEWAGMAGRILAVVMGAGFLVLMLMGIRLWWSRYRLKTRGPAKVGGLHANGN
jgi:uncharacterized iron-regulated membrane protein